MFQAVLEHADELLEHDGGVQVLTRVPAVFQTCSKRVPDVFQACSRRVLVVFQAVLEHADQILEHDGGVQVPEWLPQKSRTR